MSESPQSPSTVLCTYRVKADCEQEFRALQREHWPTLRRLGLATDDEPLVYRGEDERERLFYVEVFTWSSPEAVEKAHTHPEVMAIWEPLDALCEARDGRPNMEFPHVERVAH